MIGVFISHPSEPDRDGEELSVCAWFFVGVVRFSAKETRTYEGTFSSQGIREKDDDVRGRSEPLTEIMFMTRK